MAFQQVIIRSVENGYMVSITKLEMGERGWQPVDAHYIAKDLQEVQDFVLDKKKPALASV